MLSLNMRDPPRRHVGLGGHLHRRDALAGEALDLRHHPPLARGDEEHGDPGAPGPAGAADAVDVGLDVVGDVVVDDVADPLDVQPAGGDVGRHHDLHLPRAQAADHALALRLVHVAVHRLGGVAAPLQPLGELGRAVLGAGEDQHRVGRLGLQDAGERVQLLLRRDV